MTIRMSVDWHLVVSKVVTIGPKMLAAAYVLKWLYNLLSDSKTVGGDFPVYWLASQLARTGNTAIAYDFQGFQEALRLFNGSEFPAAWFYPPTFLLILLPLSVLPYIASLVVWILSTFAALHQMITRISPHRLTTWLLLSFPAIFLNASYGQNGFLSAALLGWGLLLLDHSPYLAGVYLGLVTYKPHLAILVPVALAAGRQWQALFMFAVTLAVTVIVSSFVFGFDIWLAFFKNLSNATAVLESGFRGQIQDWKKMVSIFSTARLAGLTVQTAWVLQGLAMCGAAAVVARVWSKTLPLSVRASVLTLAILLFSPHVLEYDLTLLTLPLAWMGWEGHTKGWLPWELPILSVIWFLPLLSKLVVKVIPIQLTPIVLILFLIFVLRRISKLPSSRPAIFPR
jgi:hypothetical protein